MRISRPIFSLTLLLFPTFTSLFAQEAKIPGHHAGDQVHYDLRVGGPEAGKVTAAYFMLKLSGSPTPEQEDHQASFTTGWIARGADGSFHAVLLVPQHPASGDYALTVLLRATPGTTIFRYDRTDFKVPSVHIESEQDLHKPEITIVERP